MQTFLL